MLVLKRREGDWTNATCECGNCLQFKVYDIHQDKVNLAFDDPDRHFEIVRPERRQTVPARVAAHERSI
jgi:sRNA-binding carbon storage regulator CsrA